jgi:hypothetical protein
MYCFKYTYIWGFVALFTTVQAQGYGVQECDATMLN